MAITSLPPSLPSIPRETDRITLGKKPEAAGASFESALVNAVGKANELQAAADTQNQAFAAGKSGHIHENMIALEKANIGLRMMVSVRNRVVEAYRDLMHMG